MCVGREVLASNKQKSQVISNDKLLSILVKLLCPAGN